MSTQVTYKYWLLAKGAVTLVGEYSKVRSVSVALSSFALIS
eukprot:CAMPEP_0196996690 /NCGR_PEP_ID=MMETSP1380-20130617/2506_1 /TAXON_ID=5936 /ORGANISM="Euplotes crassus, Strain CT5" /LENGTH=40 /DNA_ID= /DNA_START= /DNA_END= /DNA_ORIENTATION=